MLDRPKVLLITYILDIEAVGFLYQTYLPVSWTYLPLFIKWKLIVRIRRDLGGQSVSSSLYSNERGHQRLHKVRRRILQNVVVVIGLSLKQSP